MVMANSHSQRIGSVGRTERLFETKERFDHLLDLAFARSAIPGHRAFHLQRGVLRNGKPALRGSQNGDSSRLAQFERALHIFCEDKAFNRCPLRLITTDQFGQTAEDLLQAGREGITGCGDDAAVFDGSQYTVTASHHPIAGRAGPWIDP